MAQRKACLPFLKQIQSIQFFKFHGWIVEEEKAVLYLLL